MCEALIYIQYTNACAIYIYIYIYISIRRIHVDNKNGYKAVKI